MVVTPGGMPLQLVAQVLVSHDPLVIVVTC